MKKLIAYMSLAVMLLSGTAALAAEYDLKGNSVSDIDGNEYRTVLIVRDGDDTVKGSVTVDIDNMSFHSLIITDGSGIIYMNDTETEFNKGDSIFISAQDNSCFIDGKCEIILSHI